jgi:hypothetical protein
MTRYAAQLLLLPGDEILSLQIVEIDGGNIRHYPFTEELSFTQWLDGAIEIVNVGEGREEAYHLTPYDVTNRRAVDGTRRIRLR